MLLMVVRFRLAYILMAKKHLEFADNNSAKNIMTFVIHFMVFLYNTNFFESRLVIEMLIKKRISQFYYLND